MRISVDVAPQEVLNLLTQQQGNNSSPLLEAILAAVDEGVSVQRQTLRETRRATRAIRQLNRRTSLIETIELDDDDDDDLDLTQADRIREDSWQ